MSSTKC